MRKKTDAANQYRSFRMGWEHGASGIGKRLEFVQHSDTKIRDAYLAGYDSGAIDRNEAGMRATCVYGYTPDPLRGES